MQYRRLGSSNLKVSALGLGTMMFGDQTDFDEAQRIVASAHDRGINLIDTADRYNKGASEEMLGAAVKANRNDWIIATKIGNPMGGWPNQSGYSPHWIISAVDGSLARMSIDHIDILYLHRDFPDINLQEAVRTIGNLIRSGKIRAFGLSNFRGWRIAEVIRLCEKTNVPAPVVCQPYYNLLNRESEVEILPACAHYGLGVVPYSPVARGVLTGKYLPGQAPAQNTRAGRSEKRMMETEFREESLMIAQQLQQHCETRGVKLAQFATAWLLANTRVSSVIAGPRTLAQMEDYYPAVDVKISSEEETLVDRLVKPGHTSTPGYDDPSYPFFGRVTG